jgi:hypothetical protein
MAVKPPEWGIGTLYGTAGNKLRRCVSHSGDSRSTARPGEPGGGARHSMRTRTGAGYSFATLTAFGPFGAASSS